MKKFLGKFILWLPLGFFILPFADDLLLREYLFNKARYSTLPTYALTGFAMSLLVAMFYEMKMPEHKLDLRIIYKWYIALPLIFIVILLTLASMNR